MSINKGCHSHQQLAAPREGELVSPEGTQERKNTCHLAATEKKCKKAKWLSEEALQIAVKRRDSEKQRGKGKIHPFECRVPKNSKER